MNLNIHLYEVYLFSCPLSVEYNCKNTYLFKAVIFQNQSLEFHVALIVTTKTEKIKL